VTGGAQGLGLVCARALLEHGISGLVIFDIDEECGARAMEHLTSLDWNYSFRARFVEVDVSDEESVNANVEDVCKRFWGVHILLCFAGITDSKLAIEYPIESWRKIFDVNINGCFLVARAVARSSSFNVDSIVKSSYS